jgi:hypothetical protein
MTELRDLNAMLEPGNLVQHPDQPDWGVGQVQSNVEARITVNFQQSGKQVIDGTRIQLIPVYQ